MYRPINALTTGLLLLLCVFQQSARAQVKTDPWLDSLLRQQASPFLQDILNRPDSFRYQLIYTRIDRDRDNVPHFKNYYLHAGKDNYFNPASTVKMPLSFLALEKLHELNRPGVDQFTTMLTDSAFNRQTTVTTDTSAQNGLPSLAQYIRKVFLVSDNDAYNRLYEFIGQQRIHEKLWEKGYKDVRIVRRFVSMNEEENRHTNPIRFVKDGRLLYRQPPAYDTLHFDYSRQVLIGQAHYDRNDSLIHTPMDFTTHNNLPLEDLQQMLQSVLFPASVPYRQQFHLTAADYRFLYQYMSELPHESRFPHYDTSEFFDSYTKFFFFRAGRQLLPSYIRSFNKPGWSYGFLTDVAYIVDFKHHVEFMLSGVIYVNSDGVLNDNKYEYEEAGWPFFSEVGKIIYQYELQRPRRYKPQLDRFKLQYE